MARQPADPASGRRPWPPLAGLTTDELAAFAKAGPAAMKTSRRDLASVVARRQLGATTVAGTMAVAHMAGIHVFVTGGIGKEQGGAHTNSMSAAVCGPIASPRADLRPRHDDDDDAGAQAGFTAAGTSRWTSAPTSPNWAEHPSPSCALASRSAPLVASASVTLRALIPVSCHRILP